MVTGKVDTYLIFSTSFVLTADVLTADADDIPVIINANDTTIAISFFSNLCKLDSPKYINNLDYTV